MSGVDWTRADRVGGAGSSSDPTPVEPEGAEAVELTRYGRAAFDLPGKGESGPKCGVWEPAGVCTEAGHIDFTKHRCGRRSCPECWTTWAGEAAVRATHRIQSFRETQPDNYRRQAAHAVVSFPDGAVTTAREYWEYRSKAAEIAEEKGFRGFCVIAHPFRATEEAKREYRRVDPPYGLWVWLRKDVRNWRKYVVWAPHYHIIGITTPEMEPGDGEGGVTYRVLRTFGRYEGKWDRDSHGEVYGTFRYLLSHTGYPQDSTKQVTTWYGDLANNVFVEDAGADWQIQKPDERTRELLRNEIEEVAGLVTPGESDGGGEGDGEECPVEGCDGEVIDVFDVPAYLKQQKKPPPEVVERMEAAFDWRMGERQPPPGLKRPQSEEQAREAFEAIAGE